MTNVGCELLGSPVGPPCFCYSSVLSKIQDMLVYIYRCKKSFLHNEEGYRDGKLRKSREQEAAYPIPLSLPPMPHKDGVCNHLLILGAHAQRGFTSGNQQGLLLHQLLTRCNLYVVSLSLLATGPQYTFQNSVTQTTVDYILASQDASHYIQQCFTHMPAALILL